MAEQQKDELDKWLDLGNVVESCIQHKLAEVEVYHPREKEDKCKWLNACVGAP